MPSILDLGVVGLLFLSLGASARPQQCNGQMPSPVGKAVYFLTNEEQNAVAAVPISADGTLSGGTTKCTGGKGSNSIDGTTNEPAQPDPLVSQSSLSLAGNVRSPPTLSMNGSDCLQNLFAVNAGSNTLSMLSVSPDDPTQLTLVGEPVAIPGEFPNTVAASAQNGLVCVGATGAVAGVSCANFDENGIGAMDELRPFDIQQSTPPVGPTNTVSQVFWSNDQSKLFTTVKGDPTKNNTGFLSVFEVESAQGQAKCLSRDETRSSPEGTAVLFGSLPIPGTSRIFATDASFGAAILSVGADNTASAEAAQEVEGQTATCWVTISSTTNTAFVTDVGVPRIVEMSLDDASIVGELDLADTGAAGLIDLRAAGGMMYVLAGGGGNSSAQVLVMDAKTSGSLSLMQAFDLGALGAGANSQGMAVLE